MQNSFTVPSPSLPSARSLKVEALGQLDARDKRRPLVPRIRIMGQWLARAGFTPDSRVLVQIDGAGRLVLVAQPSAASAS